MATQTTHGRYVIRSAKIADEWRAQAFRGSKRFGVVQSGTTEEAVILAARLLIDAHNEQRRAERGSDGYPTSSEIRAALAAIKMTPRQEAMLNAHVLAPNNILTATELAAAGGYDSYVSANSQYGNLGRMLAEELEWAPPEFDGVPTWTFALATGADGETRADIAAMGYNEWRWKLRPEVRAAREN